MSHTPKQLRTRALVASIIGTILAVTVVLIPVSLLLYLYALLKLKKAHEVEHGETPWWAKTGPQFYRDHVKRKG